jgi:PII-like signaling protein
MEIRHEATLLRIFIGESDRLDHRPLYEAIICAPCTIEAQSAKNRNRVRVAK